MTPTLQLDALRLRVPDLPRAIEFYRDRLGFVIREHVPTHARLATACDAPPLLYLEANPLAAAPPRDAAGLFHAALLFADRAALSGWLQLAATRGLEFDGFSDHGVSEALYFSDPFGNGLEFYADRPREEWPFQNGELAMNTRPLDLRRLMAAARAPTDEPLAGARWGHLHLRVTDLERSEAFYRDTLGLEVMQRSFPGARFLAANGYHHHIGLNVWGHPRAHQPPDSLGLAQVTFARAGETAAHELADPDGISLRVKPLAVLAEKHI